MIYTYILPYKWHPPSLVVKPLNPIGPMVHGRKTADSVEAYPLVHIQKAIEDGPFSSLIFP